MPDEVAARLAVAERLQNGWRPARSVEHTWVRGAHTERVAGDDFVEDLDKAEVAPMSAAEEAVLIERQYADG